MSELSMSCPLFVQSLYVYEGLEWFIQNLYNDIYKKVECQHN